MKSIRFRKTLWAMGLAGFLGCGGNSPGDNPSQRIEITPLVVPEVMCDNGKTCQVSQAQPAGPFTFVCTLADVSGLTCDVARYCFHRGFGDAETILYPQAKPKKIEYYQSSDYVGLCDYLTLTF